LHGIKKTVYFGIQGVFFTGNSYYLLAGIKVPIETNNTLFLQGSEILKSENSMLEKNQNGADHAITNITMVNNTEFEPPFEFSPALNSQI